MRLVHVTCGALGALLLGAATAAGAFPGRPALDGVGIATPVAMCGYTCGSGGRYVPGPPGVCAEEGLRYCGSSRGGGSLRPDLDDDDDDEAPRRRGPPGYGAAPYGGPRGYGGGPARASVCITSRGNCATRPSPPGSPCSCEIPGFGLKHGAVGR